MQGYAGDLALCIEQLLGGQTLDDGAREIRFIVAVSVVRHRRKLVSAGIHDQANSVTQIVFAAYEFSCKRVEQCRIARGIGGAEIIDRIYDATPHELRTN